MRTQANSREEFFAASGDREGELRELDKFIRENAPDLKPVLAGGSGMTGKMLGYGMIPYRTKSGKETGEWPLIALAPQKHYASLYVCVADEKGYMAEAFADKLGKVSVGKSCVRFKKLSDVNLGTLKKMLQEINQRYKNGEHLFGNL